MSSTSSVVGDASRSVKRSAQHADKPGSDDVRDKAKRFFERRVDQMQADMTKRTPGVMQTEVTSHAQLEDPADAEADSDAEHSNETFAAVLAEEKARRDASGEDSFDELYGDLPVDQRAALKKTMGWVCPSSAVVPSSASAAATGKDNQSATASTPKKVGVTSLPPDASDTKTVAHRQTSSVTATVTATPGGQSDKKSSASRGMRSVNGVVAPPVPPGNVAVTNNGVIRRRSLYSWILKKVKIEGDHWIWIGALNFVGAAASTPAPAWCYAVRPQKKVDVSPVAWLDTCNRGVFEPGSKNIHLARGCDRAGCISHVKRLSRKIGSIREMTQDDLVEASRRFEEKCAPADENGCITWTGATDNNGYGLAYLFGGTMLAHRVSWMLSNTEDIPDEQIVRHLCPQKNRLCVAPDHLATGTIQDNADDEKPFRKVGEQSAAASITEDQAKMIIASYGNGRTRKERAADAGTGVTEAIVKHIDHALAWKHLLTPEQIAARSGKQSPDSLPDAKVRDIKRSVNDGDVESRAKQFGVSAKVIRRIDSGKRYAHITTDEKADELERQKRLWSGAIARIKKHTTPHLVKESNGDTRVHLIWTPKRPRKAKAGRKPQRFTMLYNGRLRQIGIVSWIAHNRQIDIPPGLVVRHKCRFADCVSPECLETGTHEDNAQDRIRDGTQPMGEKHHNSKITAEIAEKIIASKGTTMTAAERAKKFGATIGIVHAIDRGASWSHLRATSNAAASAGGKRPASPSTENGMIPTKKPKMTDK